MLEDSALTNCGTGSNLNEHGRVQCDASLMVSGATEPSNRHRHPLFGAVGAVQRVKNPVLLAEAVAAASGGEEDRHGRVLPSVLVADGAAAFAAEQGLLLVTEEAMHTEGSTRRYHLHAERCQHVVGEGSAQALTTAACGEAVPTVLATTGHGQRQKRPLEQSTDAGHVNRSRGGGLGVTSTGYVATSGQLLHPDPDPDPGRSQTQAGLERGESKLLDTVGVVCVDNTGQTAAAVSSGGVSLKREGRVGHAATFGSGCFAHHDPAASRSVAVSTSGVGEELIKTQLAAHCGMQLLQAESHAALDVVERSVSSGYLNSPMLGPRARREAGLIAIRVEPAPAGPQPSGSDGNIIELVFAHSSASLAVSYMGGDSKPRFRISRQHPDEVGKTMCYHGTVCKLRVL